MKTILKRIIQRKKYNLPKYYNNVWYNAKVHSDGIDNSPIVFDSNNKYIDCEVGLVVTLNTFNSDAQIQYIITKKWRNNSRGDWLYDSDCINCNMKFYKIIKL